LLSALLQPVDVDVRLAQDRRGQAGLLLQQADEEVKDVDVLLAPARRLLLGCRQGLLHFLGETVQIHVNPPSGFGAGWGQPVRAVVEFCAWHYPARRSIQHASPMPGGRAQKCTLQVLDSRAVAEVTAHRDSGPVRGNGGPLTVLTPSITRDGTICPTTVVGVTSPRRVAGRSARCYRAGRAGHCSAPGEPRWIGRPCSSGPVPCTPRGSDRSAPGCRSPRASAACRR